MISAWVLYVIQYPDSRHITRFEERTGTRFDSTEPKEWGLPPDALVLLTLQKGTFLNFWIEGKSRSDLPREPAHSPF